MTISQELFDSLLSWLDPDSNAAGLKYETIRCSLIRIIISNGLDDAEDLADVTIDRVTRKLPEIVDTFVGEPAAYFYAVARNVIHEAHRRKEIATDRIPEKPTQITETSDLFDCLVKCLKVLPGEKRDLILDYYLYQGKEKVLHHRRMAQMFGITDGALRTRAHNIRTSLEKCVVNCTKRLDGKQKPIWKALLKRPVLTAATSKERQS